MKYGIYFTDTSSWFRLKVGGSSLDSHKDAPIWTYEVEDGPGGKFDLKCLEVMAIGFRHNDMNCEVREVSVSVTYPLESVELDEQ